MIFEQESFSNNTIADNFKIQISFSKNEVLDRDRLLLF